MAQEVYFNYGDKIRSRKIAEAIGIPSGIGPICGFGSAKVQNDTLLVYPYALGDSNSASEIEEDRDPLRFITRGKVNSRYIPGEDVTQPMYALIARDGTLWRSTTENNNCISVPISGTNSKEVLLFAVHSPITEAVDNPVTFKAFYNNSGVDFYKIYKESSNIYWPKTDEDLIGNITSVDEDDPFLTSKSTFNFLEDKAKSAIPEFNSNLNAWVLIGIYGEGYNEQTQKMEKFSIVPYQGQGIAELPYSYGIHNFLVKAINRIETFLFKDLPLKADNTRFKSLYEYMEYQASRYTTDLSKELAELKNLVEQNILQPGSIILWDGDQVPDGWEDYSVAAGRIVIGYAGTGGINTAQGMMLTRPGDVYNPKADNGQYTFTVKGTDLPKHYHALGFAAVGMHGHKSIDNVTVVNFDIRNTNVDGKWGYQPENGGANFTKGALRTSLNLTSISDSGSITETSKETLEIDKLVPAITLRYIRKSNSYKAITQQAE